MKTFYDWATEKYLGKDTPRGDFAGDMNVDGKFPRAGGHAEILSHLRTHNACSECLAVFKRMWKDYAKQAAQNAGIRS